MGTYIALASTTVGSGGSTTFTFNNIPQTYTDLLLRVSARDNANAIVHNIALTFNSSSSGYNGKFLYTDGTSVVSENAGRTDFAQGSYASGNSATASTFGSCDIYIPSYTSSNSKTIFFTGAYENNATTAYVNMIAGIWTNSAAITSITYTQLDGATFSQHSTFTLYGISKS